MHTLAACHVHSNWSYDGSWPLEALSQKFRHNGYRVLMMTEHDRGFTPERFNDYRRACANASCEEILLLPGIEYSDPDNRIHVLTWGLSSFLGEGLATADLLKAVKDAGGVAVLAHPSRRNAWQSFASDWSESLLGIEMWNRKYDGWAPSETAPELISRADAVPFVGLDFHTQKQSFPLGMALSVGSQIAEETVIDCLRARRCAPYAFGAPLDRYLIHKALPVMRAAEGSRRFAAKMARRVGIL